MPKSLTKEEKAASMRAFIDLDDAGLTVLDRSTLERAATCPWQAKAVHDGRCKTVGIAAVAGEEGHKAFGEAIAEWIASAGAMSKADIINAVECSVNGSRPDVQPEAIKAIQPALWTFASILYSIHPANILAFDGGERVGRSGQFAIDFPDLGFRYTGEGDFLYAGDCPEVGEYVDWKTGWKCHDSESIRDSFQFQSYAVMILEKYPDWKALRVRVLDTRSRSLSYGVHFQRDRMHQWKVRIRAAFEAWQLSQQENPPTWPVLEKCGICPAASICPVADGPFKDLNGDPHDYLVQYMAVASREKAMSEAMAKWVDANGCDIRVGEVAFGRNKPKSTRKTPATIYETSNPKE